MRLFDRIQRASSRPKGYSESSFDYLNHSGRVELVRVRRRLERWYRHFPDDDGDLRNRFRSVDDAQHTAALWELVCFTLFRKAGYSITVHPDLPEVSGKPDFLLSRRSREIAYIECAVVNDRKETTFSERQIGALVDYLNCNLTSNDYFLSHSVIRAGNSQIPASKVAAYLRQKLADTDYDRLLADEVDTQPIDEYRWHWRKGGWDIQFRPIPRKNRDKPPGRVMGIRTESGFIDGKTQLRKSLNSKARQAGEPDAPYCIAVNCIGGFSSATDDEDVVDVLFGTYGAVFDRDEDELRSIRKKDGFWVQGVGPVNKKVSGVMVGFRLSCWTFATSPTTLYLNPWANQPLDRSLWSGDIVSVDSDAVLARVNGKRLGRMLGLPSKWPFRFW